MEATEVDLLREDGRVAGVRYRTPDGEHEQRALLTVGADGRDSRTRELAGLTVAARSPPMDVLWFRISRRPDDPPGPSLRASGGRLVALFDRGAYWQSAYVVAKGAIADVSAVRQAVAELAPFVADRVDEITAEGIRRLTVRDDRLRRWFAPGYLAIGDAAHAMSPVGGVGINMAIQDAVAAANGLWRPLRRGRLSLAELRRVQRRRAVPIRIVQAMQGMLHRRLVAPALAGRGLPRRTARFGALLGRPVARLIALGPFRPRVRSPSAGK
jgi:2-polyprenyl-6-methoxyphenol hydroxylase-like FAD-dependent oxidoreductase